MRNIANILTPRTFCVYHYKKKTFKRNTTMTVFYGLHSVTRICNLIERFNAFTGMNHMRYIVKTYKGTWLDFGSTNIRTCVSSNVTVYIVDFRSNRNRAVKSKPGSLINLGYQRIWSLYKNILRCQFPVSTIGKIWHHTVTRVFGHVAPDSRCSRRHKPWLNLIHKNVQFCSIVSLKH